MKSLFFLLLLLFFHTQIIISIGVSVLDLNASSQTNESDGGMVKRVCAGTMAECSESAPEMDSEINRRVLLMQKRYISYETLKRDLVPCGTPGASYYNCRGAGVANPYNRGCEVITRCARDAQT